jgi:pyruvate dehydrogenase E1 component alpha subunit
MAIECFAGDGNDVEEVDRLAEAAVRKARQGHGPTFLELKTYRWREHCGPNFDNDIGYRTESEFLEWRKRCPLERSEKRLSDGLGVAPEELRQMANRIKASIDEAVAFAKSSPFPETSTLLEHVYAG